MQDLSYDAESSIDNGNMSLTQFLSDFGDSLFKAVTEQNCPIYTGQTKKIDEMVMDSLSRSLFPAQRETVRAVNQLLLHENKPAAIINAEMGTGKTMMAIACAAVAHEHGLQRTLVLSPPHLVYKWRREILKTIPNARVWILNGTDTLSKLLQIRALHTKTEVPEFFVLGRVRMRMGFKWRCAYAIRHRYIKQDKITIKEAIYCCPKCGNEILSVERKPYQNEQLLQDALGRTRHFCRHSDKDHVCAEPLWTLCRKKSDEPVQSVYERVISVISKFPTIGPKTAKKLVQQFGEESLAAILENNIQAFSNLMDENGELVFNDRQALRLDRALSKTEFSLGQGGYQPSEFIKRYLPKGFFGLMVVDEGHEYKNFGTAQGQAMAVLASQVQKILCLTGTLMGGYADDVFYLLWRLYPNAMIEDGFRYNKSKTLGTAAMMFMREHGVLKDIVKSRLCEYDQGSFTSARAKRNTVRTAKAPGFSPLGLMRYILPMTVFLKLKDLDNGILPDYTETFRPIALSSEQKVVYVDMSRCLQNQLRQALSKGDNSLTGVVTNALLAYPDCCHKDEQIIWRRKGKVLFSSEAIFGEEQPSPKEEDMISVVKDNLNQGRKCLVYTVYSDTRDTTSRLKHLLKLHGVKAAVLKAQVKADEREDWVEQRLDEGCDVIICNPELVKTGLDLLSFPTIYFMQTGYNVYTLMQAARRSWRIGQTVPVHVYFAGYMDTAQQICLELMSKKISVSQSTSGDMPECGLDILNQSEDSIEVELARRLISET